MVLRALLLGLSFIMNDPNKAFQKNNVFPDFEIKNNFTTIINSVLKLLIELKYKIETS